MCDRQFRSENFSEVTKEVFPLYIKFKNKKQKGILLWQKAD